MIYEDKVLKSFISEDEPFKEDVPEEETKEKEEGASDEEESLE